MGRVRARDGIEIELSTGDVVVADAGRPAGDVNVLSHAHGDHLYDELPAGDGAGGDDDGGNDDAAGNGDGLVCSALTARLAEARRPDGGSVPRIDHPFVEQVPAGHVAGSRATVVTDPEDGTRYCYTGDVSTRDRFFLDGFDPGTVDADVLVIETTYGDSDYVFPEQAAEERALVDWLDDEYDRPAFLFGYALGRAQELELLVGRSGRDRLFTTDAVARLNEVIADYVDVDAGGGTADRSGTVGRGVDHTPSSFGAERFDTDVDLGPGDVVVFPSSLNNANWVERLRESVGALTVGASGWAVDTAYRFRGDYDETFVLSDHCDFTELVEIVGTIDPDRVYTQHGFADAFASHLVSLGYEARSLVRDQTALDDF
jgi:putative mRNA 3-end processing factor